MTCSIGYTGENVDKFAQVATCIRSYKLPFIIIGDWNMEPIELPHVWLSKLGAQVLTPSGVVGTCTLGKPSMLDYVVHSIELNGLLSLRPDLHGTTRPHASLVLGIHRRPRTMLATQLVKPAEFPFEKGEPPVGHREEGERM